MEPIRKVRDIDSEFFSVENTVKAVYDTNGMGDLLSVGFIQDFDVVQLLHPPVGQVYYRYKKSK